MGFRGSIRIKRRLLILTLSLCLASVGAVFASLTLKAVAQSQTPPGPDRATVVTVDYTKYTWWMMQWSNGNLACKFTVSHEGLPTLDDVYNNCDQRVYDKWSVQQPCTLTNTSLCTGYYAVMIGSEPATKQVSSVLAAPIVQVTLENCDPVYTSSTSICEKDPIMVLTGVEPIDGYKITSIEGMFGDQPFSCGAICRLRLPITDESGTTLKFWAYSSYGDSSVVFNALVRVAKSSVGDPDQSFWYVDVLSSQWAGVPLASCVEDWSVLPPVGGPPEWISTPTESEKLGTDIPYSYLAANLIRSGAVDASVCLDGGISPDGGASACGMDQARPAVTAWQNQFDDLILSVAKESGVPAHLLKNLFAKESQFWPGINQKQDVGLGQLTEQGADTTLLWNPSFFFRFCPTVMDSGQCSKGYLGLDDNMQEYARQALINSVSALCDNCPLGIDVERAKFSISVFAQTLLANCGQAGQLVENFTGDTAGKSATYEDLWKFTLANYNAGPGCLGDAIDATQIAGQPFTWENVSSHFSTGCATAINYVNDISSP